MQFKRMDVIKSLIEAANHCDKINYTQEANILTKIAQKIILSRPYGEPYDMGEIVGEPKQGDIDYISYIVEVASEMGFNIEIEDVDFDYKIHSSQISDAQAIAIREEAIKRWKEARFPDMVPMYDFSELD